MHTSVDDNNTRYSTKPLASSHIFNRHPYQSKSMDIILQARIKCGYNAITRIGIARAGFAYHD